MMIRGEPPREIRDKFECDTMVNGSQYEYHYSGPITAHPICQYSFGGRQYTVYDEGALKSVGNGLCRVLANDEVPAERKQPDGSEPG